MRGPCGTRHPRTNCRCSSVPWCWRWRIRLNMAICRRVRSCRGWPINSAMWPRNRPFTGSCAKRINWPIVARSGRRKKRSKPRAVCATQPNQLYSWDITYLPTLIRGLYFYLYVFVDVFSRKIVAAQVFAEENSAHASGLLRDLCQREKIALGQIVLHSDNGSPMKGSTMLATMITLGVMASLSRPAVSNDNPYSESLFKTLKYRPEYPMHPFTDIAAARSWVTTLVQWYNHEHRHSAIRFVTPAQNVMPVWIRRSWNNVACCTRPLASRIRCAGNVPPETGGASKSCI